MPTCQNCNNQWSWKQTVKKMFTLDTAMVCPYCGKTQYYTDPSKKRNGLLVFLAPLVMLFGLLFDIPPHITLGILVMTFFFSIAVSPFLIKITNKKEPPLW
ncbi:TIGR04104 family putative zinc finger protein [Metaplanococcus flavidus]